MAEKQTLSMSQIRGGAHAIRAVSTGSNEQKKARTVYVVSQYTCRMNPGKTAEPRHITCYEADALAGMA